MEITLTHFSEKPFILNREKKYLQRPEIKPSGLWLSDESDYGWKQWCEAHDFGIETLKNKTLIKIKTEKLCILKNSKDIVEFSDKFKCHIPGFIDWGKLSKIYSGLLIIPYCYEMRYDRRASWYYGWDCASACIWDLKCIMPEQ